MYLPHSDVSVYFVSLIQVADAPELAIAEGMAPLRVAAFNSSLVRSFALQP